MYTSESKLYIAHCAGGPLCIEGKMANRHGLIAGATGTGKTVSLQVLAETFSQAGVPCFMADMKGDLSGIAKAGRLSGFIERRCGEFGIDPAGLQFAGCPVCFYDVFGEQGHPMRARVDRMGAQLLARLMELNEVQTGVLTAAFRIARDEKLELIDLKDLRATLDYVSKRAADYTTLYGHISAASIGAIQRALLALDEQGGSRFFGEPAFDIYDLIRTENGRGVMNVLAADRLMLQPKLYSTFLLWLLTEIYDTLPEVGDGDLPKFVFFFDEAHMLFKDTSRALVEKIEQIVRLIRSKGVGVYFITQSPSDLPEGVLGQLGNRVQHALRAFTPKDQAAVRTAAQTFRANPAFATEQAITELGTGEALVSVLDPKGAPTMVEQAKMLFPLSQIGALTPEERREVMNRSRVAGKYDEAVDRRSAYETISEQQAEAAKAAAEAQAEAERAKEREQREKEEAKREKEKSKKAKSGSSFKKTLFGSIVGTLVGTFVRKVANEAAKSLVGSSRKTTKKRTTSRKR